MAQRDSGWIQIYAENAQEVYDSIFQAFRVGEHLDVELPVMVGLDGFTVSHTLEKLQVLADVDALKFVGTRQVPTVFTHDGKIVPYRLDPANPMTIGPMALPDYYSEFKRQQEEAMKNALGVIQQVNEEYEKLTGRSYGNGLIEKYRVDDAEIAVVCLGSTAGTVKTVVDDLRLNGIKAGLVRIRTFRPFPAAEIGEALTKVKAVAVLDRIMSFGGNGGAVYHETRHALYDSDTRPYVVNYVHGLGGRDTSPSQIRGVFEDLQKIVQTGQVGEKIRYVGLRE
jgi:pyruvate ferredoxin oxidoreductase alpha subunit